VTLREKISAVERVFKQLETDQKNFKKSTHLGCASGCGRCCFKPDIEATPLEFLPFAYYVFKDGKQFEWLTKLQENTSSICLLIKPYIDQENNGMCSQYLYRGLICRLFGFSGRMNKYGQSELITCQVIKTGQPEEVKASSGMISAGLKIPLLSNYYMKMHAIDADLARQFYPINTAIKKAIEIVIHYHSYRTKRSA
jgi:hypothetical protein